MSVKKYFLSVALVALCSVQRNHLCSFGDGHYEKQFCVIDLEFGPVVQEMPFKDISYLCSAVPFVQC